MAQLQYQCCFCGEQINNKLPDPCALGLTSGLTLPEEKQTSQGFYCHIECFEKKLHSSVPFYLKDIWKENIKQNKRKTMQQLIGIIL